ncbi:hypothetical protein TIFTF001_032622 [Ficus carica]|uniref:ABC-type xenobiotic transporter n=1 Tax=Ficus carica TaxID=3494 RepID=A0AA88DXJ2_FICCA|nr:hypothetical protein TIFTF001_032622 [Ficus carica]
MPVEMETLNIGLDIDFADVLSSLSFLDTLIFGASAKLKKLHRKCDKIVENIINEHKMEEPKEKSSDQFAVTEDLVDVLLKFHNNFLTIDNIKSIILDMFPGGAETSATTLGWAMAELIKQQRIMNKAQSESSLLSSILGEIPKISGTFKLCGTMAYVAQLPWIQSGMIEENILFGKEMDRERYESILEACSLKKDLEILSFGDQMVIGERGINLSGGQKQRIQIARALYQDADIYLFDDPFSAVDAHTISHLFKECLLGLLSSKTVTYATHQVEFISATDLIMVCNSGTDFMELVHVHKEALSTVSFEEAGPSEKECISKKDGNSGTNNGVLEREESRDIKDGETDDGVGPRWQLVQEEEREKGKVGFSVYWQYLTTAYTGALVPLLLLVQILFQTLQIGSNYWMGWASPVSKDAEPAVGGTTLITVYVALSIGSSFFVLLRAALLVTALGNCCGYVSGCIADSRGFCPRGCNLYLASVIAGLSVTYGLNLNMFQVWAIWTLCNMENKIISVERILQYTSIQSEPPRVIESNRPDSSWPSVEEVEIRDLQVRYAPHLPLVLRGLTCTFPGGMKTGIVGRTGSGKSTLIQALFRIVEPTAGRITIDGIFISIIGLHDLRARLSIIPQDPTMFEGTVNSNLDPLEEYTDEQIWEALGKCQLGDEVRKKEEKLNSTVAENGENWSMGQRRLVCLGRVLLKKSKVLVLDEATASVDTATDNLIQKTLRNHFSQCTVITIAHRITSVLYSDMVLLLSQGCVEEHNSPARLLENKSSSFARLVTEYTVRSNSSVG